MSVGLEGASAVEAVRLVLVTTAIAAEVAVVVVVVAEGPEELVVHESDMRPPAAADRGLLGPNALVGDLGRILPPAHSVRRLP